MLLGYFDRDLYWYYVNANKDPKVVKELLFHPKLLPGFNDSGAHITNMAYFDGNLRALKIGLDGEQSFSRMLRRYDGEASIKLIHRELFGCEQLVNRSDGVVSGVFVSGTKVWSDNGFTDQHGQNKMGQAHKVSN